MHKMYKDNGCFNGMNLCFSTVRSKLVNWALHPEKGVFNIFLEF